MPLQQRLFGLRAGANSKRLFQSAHGSVTTDATASVSLENNNQGRTLGTLSIIAQASADANNGVYAQATATISDYGIFQTAQHAPTVSAGINNAGTLQIEALANATDPAIAAYAHAYIDYGIYQYALAFGSELSASVSLTNDAGATLDIIAQAKATATVNAVAVATLSYGISQYAYDGNDSTVSLTNNGTMDIKAHAIATATTSKSFAHAIANMETGIYQYASADGGASAAASIDNGGDLTIEDIGHAKAGGVAYATATLGTGISQYAESAKDATVTLTNGNDASLTIGALATATAGTSRAYALASLSQTGIYEEADASDVDGSIASVALTNNGTIDIRAQAHASGTNPRSVPPSRGSTVTAFINRHWMRTRRASA